MHRKIIAAFLVWMLCLTLAFSASAVVDSALPITDDHPLWDEADLLTDSEESALIQKLISISRSCNAQIAIATISSADGDNVDVISENIYDSMDLGYGQHRDGVLLLVCMDPREYRIVSNGFAGDAIDHNIITIIGESIVSDLSYGNYSQAFSIFADKCQYYLEGSVSGFPFPAGKNLKTALIIGIITSLIVVLILKSQLKSVRKQNQANVYVKPGSMHIRIHNDLFLYRNVNRTRKESSSSGSGGRSSRSSGGGSF